MVVPTTYNSIKEDELSSLGVNVVIYANHLIRSAHPAMVSTAKIILEEGCSKKTDNLCLPIKDIISLIPGTD